MARGLWTAALLHDLARHTAGQDGGGYATMVGTVAVGSIALSSIPPGVPQISIPTAIVRHTCQRRITAIPVRLLPEYCRLYAGA